MSSITLAALSAAHTTSGCNMLTLPGLELMAVSTIVVVAGLAVVL